ncbi:sulfate permease [Microbacterium sp. 22303]|uniref:sulfate permease n=1 Tax=Microbacterium sp. 22303 TaxID=3453905 RepID=UPI003F82F8E7
MPTNRLFAVLRTRRGLKWGVPAMGLGVLYGFIAVVCIVMVQNGASPALYLLFALCGVNAVKFLAFGPVSLVWLLRARLRESGG